MVRRAAPPDPSIGERVRSRRQARKWSARFAASRAGVAHTTWSRVERGEIRADRYLIAEMAAALECPVTELTGQPHTPADRALETAHARVPQVWQSILEIAPDEPAATTPPALAALTERVELLEDRHWRLMDFASDGAILPELLIDLHAATTGPDGRAAHLLLTRVTPCAAGMLRSLGYVAEAAMAAERCRQSAEAAEDPAALAVAEFTRAYVASGSGRYRRALTLTSRAIDALDSNTGAAAALELLGMLHLSTAASLLGQRRTTEAGEHVSEAQRLAARTGETTAWSMWFGPANVAVWRVGLAVDAGEAGRAVEIARDANLSHLPSMRQAPFYVDLARALTDTNHDGEAVKMLLAGERAAPQWTRSATVTREAARYLLERSRVSGAAASALRGLCERIGVA